MQRILMQGSTSPVRPVFSVTDPLLNTLRFHPSVEAGLQDLSTQPCLNAPRMSSSAPAWYGSFLQLGLGMCMFCISSAGLPCAVILGSVDARLQYLSPVHDRVLDAVTQR